MVDQFGAPINGVTIDGDDRQHDPHGTTGSDGTATVTQVPTGSVSVTASAAGLAGGDAQTVTVSANATANVDVHTAACDRGGPAGSAE